MKFDAFISYRRIDGSTIAERLRNTLRNYRLPKALRTDDRRLSIYLDTIFERADDDFFERTIKPALAESRYLIVVVTPHVLDEVEGGNNWVLREIQYFRSLPQGGNVLFTTAWDEWVTAVPPEFRSSPNAEVIDLRGFRGRFRGSQRPAHNEILKLVATLYDVPPERMPDLRREDERQRLSRVRRVIAILIAIIVALGMALGYAWMQRNAARQELATDHLMNARMNADNGDAAASLLWIVAAARLHEGNRDDARIERIRFAAALRGSAQLQRVLPGYVAGVVFDHSGSRWIAYGDSTDLYDSATARRLFHLDAGPVTLGVFDDTGAKVATVAGSVVRVWDAATGRPLTPPLDHHVDVQAIAFRPGGKDLAVETSDDGVHIWNTSKASNGAQERLHLRDATRVDYDADGRRMLTYDGGQVAHIRDAQTGTDILSVKDPSGVITASFSDDGRFIATGSDDKRGRVWDSTTGAAVGNPTEPVDASASVRFSPDGTKLVVYGDDIVRLIDAHTGATLSAPLPNVHAIAFAMFTDDSRFLVTLGDGMLRAWDAGTGRPVAWIVRLYAHDFDLRGNRIITAGAHDSRLWKFDFAGGVFATSNTDDWILARFSDAAPRLVTASYDGPVRVWEIANGVLQQIWTLPKSGNLRSVAINREGNKVITGLRDGTVSLWAVGHAAPVFTVKHADLVDDIRFSPDGRQFATASWDNTARVWAVADGRAITDPLTHNKRVFSVCFSNDGREVITASEDGSARIWNARSGRRRLTLPHSDAKYAEFSADGKRVVTAALNGRNGSNISPGSAVVWDAATGRHLFDLRHADNVLHATFSPDGKRIATVSLDRTGRIWDADTGAPVAPPLQHADRLWFVRFAPDGRLAVTTCYDGTARVWDTKTGLPVTPVLWHRGGVWSVDFSADNRWLVTTSRQGDMHLWDLSPDERPLDVLDAVARVTSQQRLVAGGATFPLNDEQLARDWALISTAPAAGR